MDKTIEPHWEFLTTKPVEKSDLNGGRQGSSRMTKELSAEQIASFIMGWTCDHSGHEEKRNYIGLSHANCSVEELVQIYQDGFSADVVQRLKFYKGYQMEADLRRRLTAIFTDRVQLGGEISAFDGLVKGHPDFRFDGQPGDCKSVPLDEHLPAPGRLPPRIFWQLQAYMLYAPADRGLVIYESRGSGLIWASWIYPVQRIQNEIDIKYRTAIDRIKK